MLRAYGFQTGWGTGERDLKTWVARGIPVIVMMDVGAAGWSTWGAHWPVVYAYDSRWVYLTNWEHPADGPNRVSWANFRRGWSGTNVTRFAAVENRFLVATLPGVVQPATVKSGALQPKLVR